jgi:hypothetical protein
MRKRILIAADSTITVLHAKPHRISPRSRYHRLRAFDVTRGTFWSAALLSSAALLANSPAAAQFACTMTATDSTCTNTGNATVPFLNEANGTNQNATTTNSGTAVGFDSQTNAGGNATTTNSGTNSVFGLFATTINGGNATIANSGSNSGGMSASTGSDNSNITITNSGSNALGSDGIGGISATTNGANSNITVTHSGSNALGISATTAGADSGITVTNSGTNSAVGITVMTNGANSDITLTNSGRNNGGILASANGGASNVTVINSGSNVGSNNGEGIGVGASGNATVINSGIAAVLLGESAINVTSFNGSATLTNIVGGRVIGGISVQGVTNNLNFQGGNWLFTITAPGPTTTVNTGGAPFVVAGSFNGVSGAQVAVLDPTSFALADRALTNFTGEVQQILQGRFDGMAAGGGSGGGAALGFAGAPSTAGIADQATQAFSGIPSVAMSYASDSRPLLGKAPTAAAPYYDTTIWASGFGGERKQTADGVVLPATDVAYGGALGIDRAFGPNLRLGAFAGGGASQEDIELSVQSINSTYAFGGGYGRFDWATQYLDFSLYGGGINNSSTRQVANNTVAGGFETATASYGGWFISPALSYGYRIPFANNFVMTPRVSLRYVGGALNGYSESGSEQDLSVGRRSINDLEERAELEFSALHQVSTGGTVKSTISLGAIGLERLGNQTIDRVLLGQNLSFITPGRASAVGGVIDAGIQYHPVGNVSLFISSEGTAMSDRSYSGAASGGARVSF